MSKRPRRNHAPAFKAKVALDALKGEQTLVETCRALPGSSEPDYGVEEAASGTCPGHFQQGQEARSGAECEGSSREDRTVVDGERFFIRRARSHRRCERKAMIDKGDNLPVTRQCNLLDLSRSGVYYTPVPLSAKDMELMRQIDEIHLAYPFYGSRKIRNELWARGYDVGRDRVRRLMRRMGIEALYVKPRLSLAHPAHVKYPYLLRVLRLLGQIRCGQRYQCAAASGVRDEGMVPRSRFAGTGCKPP